MTDLNNAMANGRAWYSTMKALVERLAEADAYTFDEAAQEIQDGPLSVLVRDGWRQPGQADQDGPEEYEILLSTGGPALRIYGKLGEYTAPATAELQAQDWGTPWTRVPDCEEDVLLAYAQQFYFGE